MFRKRFKTTPRARLDVAEMVAVVYMTAAFVAVALTVAMVVLTN